MEKVKVELLGGSTIDGNAALVETPQTTFLVDYGMMMEDNSSSSVKDSGNGSNPGVKIHPIPGRVEKIDFCLVTHAHLDHSGGIVELLKKYPACSIVCSLPTHVFAQTLLSDVYRRIYAKAEIPSNRIIQVDPCKNYKLAAGVNVRFIPNGHCRGSGSIVLEINVGGKKVVMMFSGDLSDQNLPMVSGFREHDFAGINPDVLFMESTYGNQIFPPRKEEERRLVGKIKKVIAVGGNVLIPAFSFGRAQDVAQTLAQNGIKTLMDGMTAAIARTMREQSLLWGNDEVFKYHDSIKFVQSRRVIMKGRRKIVKKINRFNDVVGGIGNVVVSSSGWLQGGMSTKYLYYWLENPKNAVFFPGPFQKYAAAELIKPETEEITIPDPKNPDPITLHKKARVERFILSSHADQNGLLAFARLVNPKRLILYHGDPEAKAALAEKTRGLAPTEISEPGQVFEF